MVSYKCETKLEQARYHFSNMSEHLNKLDFKKFSFEFCSFVDACRNVTFAMQSELSKKVGFREWYTKKQEEMKKDKIFEYFKEKRNKITKQGDSSYEGQTFYYEFSAVVPENDELNVDVNDLINNLNNIETFKFKTKNGKEATFKLIKKYITPVIIELESRHVTEVCEEYVNKLSELIQDAKRKFN